MQQEGAPSNSFSVTGIELGTPQEMPRLVEALTGLSLPLGPAATWPDSLKAVVRILLTSRFPMWMAWGPDSPFSTTTPTAHDPGQKASLGAGQAGAAGMAGNLERYRPAHPAGDGDRRGYVGRDSPAHSWSAAGIPRRPITLSPTARSRDDGRIVGMLCVVMEDTVRVIGERQLGLSRYAGGELWQAPSAEAGCVCRHRARPRHIRKICLARLPTCSMRTAGRLKLVARTGWMPDHPAASADHRPGRNAGRMADQQIC